MFKNYVCWKAKDIGFVQTHNITYNKQYKKPYKFEGINQQQ